MNTDPTFTKNFLPKEKLGHPVTAWLWAGMRCPNPKTLREHWSHAPKKILAKKKLGHPVTALLWAGTTCPNPETLCEHWFDVSK